jgi:lipoprotein-anchoring transpeptidase ErfK/SrfK
MSNSPDNCERHKRLTFSAVAARLAGSRLTLALAAMASMSLSGCADTRHRIVVSVPEQRMAVLRDDQPLAYFRVSTSRFGLGDFPNSNFTPLGRMVVAEKFGGGLPAGMKLKDRVPTGEIVPVNAQDRDPIVTRIFWLKGTEPWNARAHERYIYIHGTPQENKLGRPASYGCVRMASRDVIWLYDTVGAGAKVDILPYPLPQAIPKSLSR